MNNYLLHQWKTTKFIYSVFILSALYILFGILISNLTNGYKEGYGSYFINPAFFGPAILIIFSKRSFTQNLLSSLLLIFLLTLSSELFWNYMDKPWFSPQESNNCDGPCYGWFSFENDSPLFIVLLTGGLSIILGSLIRFISIILKRGSRRYLSFKLGKEH